VKARRLGRAALQERARNRALDLAPIIQELRAAVSPYPMRQSVSGPLRSDATTASPTLAWSVISGPICSVGIRRTQRRSSDLTRLAQSSAANPGAFHNPARSIFSSSLNLRRSAMAPLVHSPWRYCPFRSPGGPPLPLVSSVIALHCGVICT
jgi:hypothetical protein